MGKMRNVGRGKSCSAGWRTRQIAHYLISNWNGLNRPPMVAQRGHFRRAPCSPMRTSTHAWHKPQIHSVQAYDSLSSEMPWHAAQ